MIVTYQTTLWILWVGVRLWHREVVIWVQNSQVAHEIKLWKRQWMISTHCPRFWQLYVLEEDGQGHDTWVSIVKFQSISMADRTYTRTSLKGQATLQYFIKSRAKGIWKKALVRPDLIMCCHWEIWRSVESTFGIRDGCAFLYLPTSAKAVTRRVPPNKDRFKYSTDTTMFSGHLNMPMVSNPSNFWWSSTNIDTERNALYVVGAQ